jgi:rubredoxin-NAD+ reductase
MTVTENLSALPVVIVGAGLAGWTTARELRKLDASTPIVLITNDSGDFYAKPSLSNAFAQAKLPAQLVSTPAARMAETQQVTLLAHTRVTAIDTAHKTLQLSGQDGNPSTLAFRDLVLATGAQPIRVPVAGNAAARVQSVNSLDDFAAFHADLQAAEAGNELKPEVLIVGAGLIGCEFANDLAQGGYAVRVVDPGSRPLAALLPAQVSLSLQQALQALGVRFYFGTTLSTLELEGSAPSASSSESVAAGELASQSGRLRATLANGETFTASVVLSAVGLRADTSLAQAAGLKVDRGIVVDKHLRTSAAHVYALGDAAQYASAPSGLSAYGSTLPYVMPIMNAAKALAAALAGSACELVFPLMPVSIKTPALPLVVAAARPGLAGGWQASESGQSADAAPGGVWHWLDEAGLVRGFVLAGAQTAQRMAQSKLVTL